MTRVEIGHSSMSREELDEVWEWYTTHFNSYWGRMGYKKTTITKIPNWKEEIENGN